MDTKKIGQFLKFLRRENGFTQEELAEKLNVSSRTVSRWETGANMPDLSILMEIAELYQVEIMEILDGEKEGMQMDKTSEKTKNTLAMIADYGDEEKEKALKIGNSAFGIMFVCCAAAIIIQMVAFNDLWLVAGETVTLILGGILYILLMTYNGVWDKGSKIRSTPLHDAVISTVCSGIFTVIYVLAIIQKASNNTAVARAAVLFFAGITVLSFFVLRLMTIINRKRKQKNKKE